MELSIVITTYKRLSLLRLCLSDLSMQCDAFQPYEVIVVDNAGQQECEELVQEFDFLYIHERKTGLSHARNRGLKEAKSPWVLFFDDDVRLHDKIISEFLSLLPGVRGVAFGGRFTHWYLKKPPPWLALIDGKGNSPGVRITFGVLPPGHYLIGCFFAVHKETTISLGGFDPELGMKGEEVNWADETELQYRMRKHGFKVYYAPELVIEHLRQPWKCSLTGQFKMAYSQGTIEWQIGEGSHRFPLWLLITEYARITFMVIPVTLGRWLLRHPEWYWQNAFLIVFTKYVFALGQATKRWNITVNKT